MKLCFVTNIVSPHQVPLAMALVDRLGTHGFRYIATEQVQNERIALGWGELKQPEWMLTDQSSEEARRAAEAWMSDSDVLICGNRDFDCFEKRVKADRPTLYMSERWFKPPVGMWRLLHPRYCRLALRFFRLLESPQFYYLPMGVHAARDIQRLFRLYALLPQRKLIHAPLTIHDMRSKLLLWGYFVKPSDINSDPAVVLKEQGESEDDENATHALTHPHTHELFRILWVGRMLNWKRVDTLIKAVALLIQEGRNVHLTLVGQGPEESKLRKLAACVNNGKSANRNNEVPPVSSFQFPVSSLPSPVSSFQFPVSNSSPITFLPPVPISQVRELMRQAEVYVLPSDGGEGWGAVVNEAMEEGCPVIATHESGSGATVIKGDVNGLLFHAGDVDALALCLQRLQDRPAMRMKLAERGYNTAKRLWNPEIAANRLVSVCEALISRNELPKYADGPMAEMP